MEESNTGWTTKQVKELIIQESWTRYHHDYIYRILRKWGFRQKIPRKVHVNTASKEEKEEFNKRQNRYLWIFNTKAKKKRKTEIVSLDEFFLFLLLSG